MKWTERLPVSRPFAGIVAIYLGVGLAGAFVMFGYYGGPDGADEWTTTGTLFYDYLTLGLLIAAVYGGFKLSEQIRQTERHHTEQLQASFRPLVLIERAFPFSDPGGMFFGIRMQNPGPGVALDVRVKAWARFIDLHSHPQPVRRQSSALRWISTWPLQRSRCAREPWPRAGMETFLSGASEGTGSRQS